MKKLKKGFTLIELIASIGILAVIVLMATISYSQIRKNILESQYSNLKVLIEQTAVKYSSKNGYRYFFVQNLIDDGMLETDDDKNVYDPRDKSILNCHILSVIEDENGNLGAQMLKDDHTESGKCKTADIDVYKGNLSLSAVLDGTTIEYPGSTEVTDSTIFPRITLDGWTNEQIKLTAVLDDSMQESDRQGGRFVWNKDSNVVTEYPNNTMVTNATGVVNEKYFVDFYSSAGDQYEASLGFKFDSEPPVIFKEENNKPKLASGSTNSKWSRSKTVIVYATDKDGVGLQRIYIGKSACSNMRTNANLGQPAIPGMIQTVTVYDNVGTTAENYHICAIDRLGNLVDAGTIAIARIDNTPPDVEETFYVYRSDFGKDAAKYYPTTPLDSFVNRDIDIANYHTNGWTAVGHFYAFKVTDTSSTYDQMKITVNYTAEDGEYKDNVPLTNKASRTLDDINCFYDAFTGKGKRRIRYEMCDALGNCRNINITNDNVDKTAPVQPTMNFIINATNGEVYDGNWINKTVIAARSTTAAAPTTTDKGSGVAVYQISDDNTNWTDYSYNGNSSMYALSSEGTHTRYFRAIDKVGNISTVKTVTAKIDKTKPMVRAYANKRDTTKTNNLGDILETERIFTTDGTLNIRSLAWSNYGIVIGAKGEDSLSGVKKKVYNWDESYSVNEPTSLTGNSDVTSTSGTNFINLTGEGFRVAKYTVTDNAGNSTAVTFKMKIDTSKPTGMSSKLRTNNSSGTVRSNTTNWTKDTVWWGDFSANDTYSGVDHYEYNSGANCTDYAGVLGSSGYIYGGPNAHYAGYVNAANIDFCSRAVDKAGNVGDWHKYTYIRVDKLAPTVRNFEGALVHTDTEFDSGNNDMVVYNNSKNGTVTHTRMSGSTPIGGNYYIRIKTAGTASPGLGGFYFADPVVANKEYILYMYAKIPTGYTLKFASNACGSNPTYEWITDNVGTGSYKVYVHHVKCGSSGSFANTNFFYLDGPAATASSPVTWDVEYVTILDPTKWAKVHWSLARATDEHSKLASYKLVRPADTVEKSYNAAGSAIAVDKISSAASHTLSFTDVAGNTTTKTFTAPYVDVTPPTCGTVSGAGSTSSWTNGSRTISVVCNDAGVGCSQSSFSNTFSIASGSYKTTDNIQIKDSLGNARNCPVNVYIDRIAPSCGTVSGASTTWTNSNRTVSVGCSDNNSGCQAATVSGTWSSTTTTGNITIRDNAGNTKDCSVNVYVDKIKPTVKVTAYKYDSSKTNNLGTLFKDTVTYSSDGGVFTTSGDWLSHGIAYKIEASDAHSGVKSISWYWDQEYIVTEPSTITGGPSTTSGTVLYPSLTGAGFRKAKVVVTDNAGNTTTIYIVVKIAGTPTCGFTVNTGDQLNPSSDWYSGEKLGLTLSGTTYGQSATYKNGWVNYDSSCSSSTESNWGSVGTTNYDVTISTRPEGRLICGKITVGSKVAYCSFLAKFDNRNPIIKVNGSESTTSLSVKSGSSVSFTCADEPYTCSGGVACYSGADHGILSYDNQQINTLSQSVTVTRDTAFNYKCYDKAGNKTERVVNVTISSGSSSGGGSNPPSVQTCNVLTLSNGMPDVKYYTLGACPCPSGYFGSGGSYVTSTKYGCNKGTSYTVLTKIPNQTWAKNAITNAMSGASSIYSKPYTSGEPKYWNRVCSSGSVGNSSATINCNSSGSEYYTYDVYQYKEPNLSGTLYTYYKIIRYKCDPKSMSEYVGDANQGTAKCVCCKN